MNDTMKSTITYFANRLAAFDNEELDDTDTALLEEAMIILGNTPKLALVEEMLSRYKSMRNNIVRNDLPLALAEEGLTAVTLGGGVAVSLATFYETKQIDKEKVASWLEEKGYGDIIKDTLLLPKGAYTEALDAFLVESHIDFKRDSTINGNQLKSVVRKHLESGGTPPPQEAMKVDVFVQAVIKKEKISL